ncbi:MAG: EamA family transporter, partial [Candidatus Omnitrophota bacterium]
IIMAVFLILVSFSLKKFQGFSLKSFNSSDWLLIILAGIAGALSWIFYFSALKTGLATKVVVIDRLSLVFVIILAAIFLGEHFGLRVIIGALLMIAGAIVITLK